MGKQSNLHHFFQAVDRAHKHQKSVVLALSLSIEDQKEPDPLTVEFEILPPSLDPTDTNKRRKTK